MDTAYSKEYGQIIDAQKAYELMWREKIYDLRAFTCPEEGCDAQVTLANGKCERRFMKQRPSFRCYGTHHLECQLFKKKKKICLDILVLDQQMTSSKRKASSIKKSESNCRQSAYKTIMPIVGKFLLYQSLKALSAHHILCFGRKYTYDQLFVSLINRVPISTEYRIYYGAARFVKHSEKEDYMIFFLSAITYNETKLKPSAYISKKIIQNSYKNQLWEKELADLSKNKTVVQVFILGKLVENRVADKCYLNIKICSAKLDLIDIRRNI